MSPFTKSQRLKVVYIFQTYLFCFNVRNDPNLAHLQKQGSSVRVWHHRAHRGARHRHLMSRYMDRGPCHTSPTTTTTWAQPHLDTCANTKCILQTCTPRPKKPANILIITLSVPFEYIQDLY